MAFPRLIGICGNPKSGKSTLQKILLDGFNYLPIDDGYPLRDFAMRHLGLSWDDVHSQEGKARYTDVLGTVWQNRKILGDLGAQLEAMFGEHIMMWMATRTLEPDARYSLGSVRKTQAHYLKAQGGLIIGLTNPLAPPSPYEFDKFDASAVDIWIHNDAQSLGFNEEEGKRQLALQLAVRLAEHQLGPIYS